MPSNFAAINLSPLSFSIAPTMACFSRSAIRMILVSDDLSLNRAPAPVIELGRSVV